MAFLSNTNGSLFEILFGVEQYMIYKKDEQYYQVHSTVSNHDMTGVTLYFDPFHTC